MKRRAEADGAAEQQATRSEAQPSDPSPGRPSSTLRPRSTWRRIASLVLLVGALLVGAKLFTAVQEGPVPVEIHYLLGDPPRATGLEVLIQPEGGGPAVARFETTLISSDVKQITRLPGGRHDMDITMIGQSGARRTVRRSIEAVRDVVIRIDLSRDLP